VVMSQSVAPNTMAPTETSISIVVSTAAPSAGQMSMPDFAGQPLAVAQKEILNSGLVLGRISFQANTKLVPNTVLEQYPRAGEIISRGSKVDLFVSSISNQRNGPEN